MKLTKWIGNKLTDWIPGNVKPVRVGVYQREYDNGGMGRPVWYCYWNGKCWGVFHDTPEKAKDWEGVPSNAQTLPWRGLAEKP